MIVVAECTCGEGDTLEIADSSTSSGSTGTWSILNSGVPGKLPYNTDEEELRKKWCHELLALLAMQSAI